MPQPAAVEALSEDLRRTYRAVWEEIAGEQASIVDDPARWRRRARLTEMQRSVEASMAAVDRDARAWLQQDFPEAYRMGAGAAADELGEAATWTAIDRRAVSALAADTFDDLLSATQHVRRTTKLLVRELARSESLRQLAAGRTGRQAAAELRRLLNDRGIFAVTYRDGSRHGLAEYSDIVLRAKTGEAYNVGTLNFSRANGVGFMEIFDGADCGWIGHDDGDKANGTVRSIAECMTATLSHPRCQRSMSPRPDIASAEGARKAAPSTTVEQRADQAASERTRAAATQRRATDRQRRARQAERRTAQQAERRAARAARRV